MCGTLHSILPHAPALRKLAGLAGSMKAYTVEAHIFSSASPPRALGMRPRNPSVNSHSRIHVNTRFSPMAFRTTFTDARAVGPRSSRKEAHLKYERKKQ
jgi:hypothetical protein